MTGGSWPHEACTAGSAPGTSSVMPWRTVVEDVKSGAVWLGGSRGLRGAREWLWLWLWLCGLVGE